jgi:hypothetical protein
MIVQPARQTNNLCERQGWQSFHPCSGSYFYGQLLSFSTCSSLVRIMFWPCS